MSLLQCGLLWKNKRLSRLCVSDHHRRKTCAKLIISITLQAINNSQHVSSHYTDYRAFGNMWCLQLASYYRLLTVYDILLQSCLLLYCRIKERVCRQLKKYRTICSNQGFSKQTYCCYQLLIWLLWENKALIQTTKHTFMTHGTHEGHIFYIINKYII